MTVGIVKWFNDEKRCGYIQQDDGKELFVHYSRINCLGVKTLQQGKRVVFEIADGPKGFYAENVTQMES